MPQEIIESRRAFMKKRDKVVGFASVVTPFMAANKAVKTTFGSGTNTPITNCVGCYTGCLSCEGGCEGSCSGDCYDSSR